MKQKLWAQSILVVGAEIDLFPDNPNKIIIEPERETIGVGKIRELKRTLAVKPVNKTPIVVTIPLAKKLTEEAQNALLKLLEEPPENVYIILTVPDADLLLPTVVSRCQIISNLSDLSNLSNLSDLKSVLSWLEEGSVPEGFAWAEKLSYDRSQAVAALDSILAGLHREIIQNTLKNWPVAVRVLSARKALLANANIRLTLENLFLN